MPPSGVQYEANGLDDFCVKFIYIKGIDTFAGSDLR